MKIAFFITGHGFGHGVRISALIEKLPENVAVDIYTSLPSVFFLEELHRPYELISCEIDCGCLQTDTVKVDVLATLRRYSELDANRSHLIARFSRILTERGTDLVIGDIPPLAFPIAKAAGIVSWSLCNFNWVDIYRPYLTNYPEYQDMILRMESDYALAGRQIRFYPYMDVHSNNFEKIGMVCRPGANRRTEFSARFNLDHDKKWCLIYVGSFGLEGVAWQKLKTFSDWEFLGLYPLENAPDNYRQINKDPSFRYADLTASCDLVLGKLGYGLVTECLSLGKPVLFLGREDFAEFSLLRNLLEKTNMGVEIPLESFLALTLEEALKSFGSRKFESLPATGVTQILKMLENYGVWVQRT